VKVFLALAQPPLGQGGAAGRCAWALMQGLRAHGLDVQALAARGPFSPAEPPPDPSVEIEDIAPERPLLGRRLRRFTRPRGELAGAFAERVRAQAADADVLHLDELESSWCGVRAAPPTVLHLHYLVEEDRGPGLPWKRAFRTYVEERLAERLAVRRHDALVANSPLVAERLHRLAPRARVTVVPLTLDPAEYERAPLNGELRAGLIGTLDWSPTAAAVRELLWHSWPLVQREVPDARLLIAGRGTERLHVGAGATALGPVASSSDFFHQLSVMLYPLARGSGMKVKVLEAMACGVPVVTTPAGAEGVTPNDGVVVTETKDDFVRHATHLLRDSAERAERGAAGLACFSRRYAPEPATEPLVALYATLAGTASSKSGAERSSRRS
jgi:glycosyltransferase involved in cell wall biosynthesis